MSVTINSTGSSSRQIVVSGEVSATNIIAGINTALLALGWTLYDSVSSGSRNMLTTRVYSAVNNDGASPTTKYMILRYDLPKSQFYVSCCESWDAGSNVPTNEASLPKTRKFPIPLQFSSYTLYIFATARYCAFMPLIGQEPGMWQGIFEFEREASEDTAALGVPCFGWTCAVTLGSSYANLNATSTFGAAPQIFSVPRVKDGTVGTLASQKFAIATAFGVYPPPRDIAALYNNSNGITAAINSSNGMLGTFGSNLTYAWDTVKKVISNLKLTGSDSAYPTGKVYGLKVIPPLGGALDTVIVPVDANGFFVASGGTDTNHAMLTLAGGYTDLSLVAANRIVYTPLTSSPAGASTITAALVLQGTVLYYVAGTVLRKVVTTTGLDSLVATLPASGNDLIFDGTDTLYISTATGVSKVSVSTESLTSLTVGTGGIASLGIDDTYLYGADVTTSVNPGIRIIDLTAFTLARSASVTTSTVTACRLTGMYTPDYTGAVITTNLGNSIAATTNYRAYRFLGADATQIQSPNSVSGAISLTTGASAFYDGTAITVMGGDATNSYYNSLSITDLTNTTGTTNNLVVVIPNQVGGTTTTMTPVAFKGYAGTTQSGTSTLFLNSYRHGNALAAAWSIATGQSVLTGGGVATSQTVTIGDGINIYRCLTANNISKFSSLYINRNSAGVGTANVILPF